MQGTAIVIGLGSMGRRRIRLLHKAFPDIKIFGVDTNKDRQHEVAFEFDITGFDSICDAIKHENISYAFVCTSPLSHAKIIRQCLEENMEVFTEINLIDDDYDELIALAKKKNRTLFLSSTFLYRNDINYIIKRVKNKKVNYIAHIGQYLPDWHPWESYKNYFIGDKRTNGCREIFAIDLPWIIKTFGEVESFHVQKDKNSQLDINYFDNYIISLKHKNGNKGALLCDLITRRGGRTLRVFSEELDISWAGTPDSLYDFNIEKKQNMKIESYTEKIDQREGYNPNIIENAYLEEIKVFFDVVKGTVSAPYGFEDDKKTIAIINAIEGIE